jgi:hypothetical protein
VAYSTDCLGSLLARAGLAVVARVDEAATLTSGRPIRTRLLARKATGPVPLPPRPLRAAVQALTEYAGREGSRSLFDRFAPVRLRAGLADAARREERRRRKAARSAARG